MGGFLDSGFQWSIRTWKMGMRLCSEGFSPFATCPNCRTQVDYLSVQSPPALFAIIPRMATTFHSAGQLLPRPHRESYPRSQGSLAGSLPKCSPVKDLWTGKTSGHSRLATT